MNCVRTSKFSWTTRSRSATSVLHKTNISPRASRWRTNTGRPAAVISVSTPPACSSNPGTLSGQDIASHARPENVPQMSRRFEITR